MLVLIGVAGGLAAAHFVRTRRAHACPGAARIGWRIPALRRVKASTPYGLFKPLPMKTWTANTLEDRSKPAFDVAKLRIMARSVLTALIITIVFGGIAGVLWVGRASDVQSGVMSGGGSRAVYLLRHHGGGKSAGGLSETWGEIQRAAGATETLDGIAGRRSRNQSAGQSCARCQKLKRGEVAFEERHLALSRAARACGSQQLFTDHRPRRNRCAGRPIGGRQEYGHPGAVAVL